MDLVVPVREGYQNQQLRYALRSWAANLPHRRVWLVGGYPQWVHGAGHIPTRQTGTKWQNTTVAVRAACEHPEVSPTFVLCDDDFFVMRPVDGGMPVFHRGPVDRVEAYHAARGAGAYLDGLRETRALLAELGHPAPVSYELHVPLPVEKAGMVKALDAGRHIDVLHKRTLYGALAEIGGEELQDVKVMHRGPRGFGPDSPFLSTMPDSFANGMVGHFIRRSFPRLCQYEIPGRT